MHLPCLQAAVCREGEGGRRRRGWASAHRFAQGGQGAAGRALAAPVPPVGDRLPAERCRRPGASGPVAGGCPRPRRTVAFPKHAPRVRFQGGRASASGPGPIADRRMPPDAQSYGRDRLGWEVETAETRHGRKRMAAWSKTWGVSRPPAKWCGLDVMSAADRAVGISLAAMPRVLFAPASAVFARSKGGAGPDAAAERVAGGPSGPEPSQGRPLRPSLPPFGCGARGGWPERLKAPSLP